MESDYKCPDFKSAYRSAKGYGMIRGRKPSKEKFMEENVAFSWAVPFQNSHIRKRERMSLVLFSIWNN